jgi:hypothetical protein
VIACYFAYGSNMNPARVRERGLAVSAVAGAWLPRYRLAFDKASSAHAGVGHANVLLDHDAFVEGVLYWLAGPEEILKMDRFESTPVNYSRDVVTVQTARGAVQTWTYFANPAVRRKGLRPPRSYLNHLLAGRPYLSPAYYRWLAAHDCEEGR